MSKSKILFFGVYPSSYEEHLSENIEAFSRFPLQRRMSLTSLLWVNISNAKRYQHSLDETCFSISAKLLDNALGEKYLAHMLATGLFEIGIEYNPNNGTTRGYRVTQLAYDLLGSYKLKDLEKPSLIGKTGQVVRVGKNAIRSKDNKGNDAKFKGQILPLVNICLIGVGTVQASLDRVKDWIYYNVQPIELNDMDKKIHERFMQYVNGTGGKKLKDMEKAFQSYQALLTQINIMARVTNRPTGTIPCRYTEIQTGRIYGEGINPQTWPRELRKAALAGQYDYDFENCHYSIFAQLAKREGKQTPAIDGYLAKKDEVRKSLSDDIGVSEDDIKKCLIALIYGARSVVRERKGDKKGNAVTEIIGAEKAAELFSHPLYRNMKVDIKNCRESIVGAHKRSQRLVNAMNKALPLKTQFDGDGKKVKQVDFLSHILQGYESKMLETVVQLHGESITVLQHDGWTSSDPNICLDNLSSQIEARTGLIMAISKEPIPYHQAA